MENVHHAATRVAFETAIKHSTSQTTRRGPADLLFAVRPYLLVGGSILATYGVFYIVFVFQSPWNPFARDEGRTRSLVLFFLNVASLCALLVGLAALAFRRIAPAARSAWITYGILTTLVVAVIVVENSRQFLNFGMLFSAQWCSFALTSATEVIGWLIFPVQGALLAVFSRRPERGWQIHGGLRTPLGPSRPRTAALIVMVFSTAYSLLGALQIAWSTKVAGIRSFGITWRSTFFGLGTWTDRLAAVAVIVAFVGGVVATAAILRRQSKWALVMSAVVAASALVVALQKAFWNGYSLHRFSMDFTDNAWARPLQYGHIAAELLAAVAAYLLLIAVVSRYARSLKESTGSTGRAFEPILLQPVEQGG